MRALRSAARRLAKAPAFTAVSVLTLGLGVGASTGVFTVARRALLESLPYREPDRLVHLFETKPSGRSEASYPDYLAWKTAPPLASAAGYTVWPFTLKAGDRLEAIDAAAVTASFFDTLGVDVASGRTFAPGDEVSGAPGTAILTVPMAVRLFGSVPAAVGHDVELYEKRYQVVGVLPAGFSFAPAGAPQIWVALQPTERHRTRGYHHWLNVVARLGSGESIASARAALAVAGKARATEDPRFHGETSVTAVPLRDEIVGPVRPVLVPLAVTAALVLLVAATNAGLGLLARGLARAPELAVRQALGADRARLVRELLAESLSVGVLGGILGIVLAGTLLPVLAQALPRVTGAPIPYLANLQVDVPTVAFAVLVALLAGLAAGLLPALAASRDIPSGSLGAGRSAMPRGGRLRYTLIAAQTVLTTVLLVGTALLVKSTRTLLAVDPGFRPERLLTLRVQLPLRTPREAIAPLHDRVLAELASLPGASGAASVSKLPLSGGGDTGTPAIDGGVDTHVEANLRTASPGYFGALGLPLVSGRAFSADDLPGGEPVVVINRSLARLLGGDEGVLGKRLRFTFVDHPLTVVGVVGDENVTAPDRPVTPVLYFPFAQDTSVAFSVVVRTSVPPETLAPVAAERVAGLASGIVVSATAPMERLVEDSPAVAPRKSVAMLMGLFAVLALGLSAVGLANVVAGEATRRTREIGVRLALGARRTQVTRHLLRNALSPLGVGLAIGLPVSVAAARLLASLLFGVTSTDVTSYAATAAALAIAGLAAAAIPAVRAARLDPADALRQAD